MADMKGFLDFQKLLSQPGQGIHCAEMMGKILTSTGAPLLDEKARSATTWRIRKAIAKKEKVHPILGKHLSNSIIGVPIEATAT